MQDISDLARLVDALDNIHFYLVPVYPTNMDKDVVGLHTYYAGLANTTQKTCQCHGCGFEAKERGTISKSLWLS